MVVLTAGSVLSGLLLFPTAGRAQETVPLPARDRPIHLNLEPFYELGRVEGRWWEHYQALNAASFAPDGRLYLLDAPGDRVIAFDPRGRILHPVGRPGEGPGEYEIPTNVIALPDGGAAVWDVGKDRFIVYDGEGELVDEILNDFSGGRPENDARLGSHGDVLALARRLVSSRDGHAYLTDEGVRDAGDGLPLLRIPLRDGAEARVIRRVPMPKWRGTGDRIPTQRAYEPSPSWGPLAGGRVALQYAEEYRVDIVGPDGSVERTLTRPLPPSSVTDEDREAWADHIREEYEGGRIFMAGGGSRPGDPVERLVEETWFHPRMPLIMRITTDGERHIWVQRRSKDDPTRPGPVDILTVEGRYVGTVAGEEARGLPDAFGPDGLVVWFETAELDVPVARVFRLPRGLSSR